MASGRVPEREVREESRRAATANPPDFSIHRYSLLIITGRTAHLEHTGPISRDIERGIRSWDIDLQSCNLDLYLQEFLSHHTASFKGAGQKCLRHSTRVLDTQVLISPSQEQARSEVCALLSRDSAHKLLILAGQSEEGSGDLVFHQGLFSPQQLKRILTEQFIDQESSASSSKLSLTLSCPNIGQWRKTLVGNEPFTLRINPPEVLPAMETLGEFTSLISGTLSPPSPFDLLPPPVTVGFLKLSRPCCYVFPAGRGDCAFFAVNGFTVLVDGGSDSQACFWKLVRHLDRVDAILLTHIGTENLPGVNVFLERKVAELELSADIKDDSSKRLISPELGVVFFNAPCRLQVDEHPCLDGVLKSAHQAALTLQLLKKLDIRPQPLFRPPGVPLEPLTLFQKMGVGQLDLYILSPGKNSQEYQTLMQDWPDVASESKTLPVTTLASVSALLVWHPACPQEKVVRVLFPGVTPQEKLLLGLEKLKGLAFLQKPTVTTGDMDRLGEGRKIKESQESGRPHGKESTPKHGKEAGLREEGKEVPGREKGKVLNGVNSRDADKTRNKDAAGVKQKAASTEKNASKKGGRTDGKKEEKPGNNQENGRGEKDILSFKPKNENKIKLKKEARNDFKTGVNKTRKPSGKDATNGKKVNVKTETKPQTESVLETEPEGYPPGSTLFTPEDMTEDSLRPREETERGEAHVEKSDKAKESGKEKSFGGLSVVAEEAAEIMGGESGDKGAQDETRTGEKADADLQKNARPEKVLGFPSPLNKAPKNECEAQLDLTPTEYTLLDGALRNSPPSRSSPENRQEPASPDSRPNSAGHTPYCLSPGDVWCNRATLNRLQGQMGDVEPADVNQSDGSSKQSEKSNLESHTAPRERQLSFLSLGSFKEGPSDPFPSFTTTTTHSMPAEVSSPQSTEVDESLSMSLEQGPTTCSQREGDDSVNNSHSNGGHFAGMSLPIKKPARSSAEIGRPPSSLTLNLEASARDVDLCLVSPCEFKHLKQPESGEPPRGAFHPHHHGTNNANIDASPSESCAPVLTEDCCPSTTADGCLDSDEEDESSSEPSNSPRGLQSGQALPPDPLPVPFRDNPPPPPHPDASMPVPQAESDARGKKAKATGMRGKKTQTVVEVSQRSGSGKSRTGIQSGVPKGGVSSARTPSSGTRPALAKSSPNPGAKCTSGEEVSVYVDLAYIPSGPSSPTVGVDFFRCIRSSCYVVSGDSQEKEEIMRRTLDALLDAKTSWPDSMQVTLIPTFESVPMQEWYQQTLDRQKELGIAVLGSNSTVAMQDETFPACKIEF
ncbi:microtubule-associated protein 1S-like [Pseudoliparis swirei]|uniref:microtubule-associated protein 1S-like n=1 Tax=Pseudoliparis swirei TaxID=2059687 RepID=UPI0024BE9775|nr:microtubule-associated protein 1S-like [Pseudoliparis swirei]